ncbi:low temperature requirement protein A [Nocardia stercoris]|uniref:Low temperature requirement protein A n=2 Tax=Nocardia stercoris TaxID=2483361 RepID=A0A3M2L2B0_9NOCA|nr:low temperature requirement protein A [Nocardia stercoris]
MPSDAESDMGGQIRVSTLELFFDLVFVFTITQLTHTFAAHAGWSALGKVALVFAITWWMYSGFVWLTNEVAPTSSASRTGLLVGMLGFFLLSLAVPDAFGGSGVAFGLAYLLVTVVHTTMFWVAGGAQATRSMLRLAPLNLATALIVMAGGFFDSAPRELFWLTALILQIVTPYLFDAGGFIVRTSHFCERHGLVLIIAVGESVVAIGSGLVGEPITVGLVVRVVLGLTLAYALWWAYFGMDDERGEQALEAVPGTRRSRTAALSYGYCLYPMLIGIILAAAGMNEAIAHSARRETWAMALALSGGVALFFTGQAAFRTVLGLPRPWIRLLGAAAVLATAPSGVYWPAWVQLSLVLVVGYGSVIADDLLSLRAGTAGHYLDNSRRVVH